MQFTPVTILNKLHAEGILIRIVAPNIDHRAADPRPGGSKGDAEGRGACSDRNLGGAQDAHDEVGGIGAIDEEIHRFITDYTDGSIPDYQMSALAMAIYFNGMNARETADLTIAMQLILRPRALH